MFREEGIFLVRLDMWYIYFILSPARLPAFKLSEYSGAGRLRIRYSQYRVLLLTGESSVCMEDTISRRNQPLNSCLPGIIAN